MTHALAAPDYPLAASLMEQAAPAFWLSGEASTVHTWVLALPDPMLRALIEVRAYFSHGDKERLHRLTHELEALPPDEEVSWNMIPLSFAFRLALALQQDSAMLVGWLRSSKRWISEAGDHLVTFRVMTWLARVYIEAGQLHLAHQECLGALALLKQIDGSTALAGFLQASVFDISYAWNRLEAASDALQRLQCLAQDWQQVELLAIGERSVARLALARGDLGTAQGRGSP